MCAKCLFFQYRRIWSQDPHFLMVSNYGGTILLSQSFSQYHAGLTLKIYVLS